MVRIEDVPEGQRLNYFTGDIVISDSFAEHEARVLWNTLYDVKLVSGKRPEMFGALLPRLQEAFERPEVPEDIRGIALGLIETTQRWHRYRRDMVHDLLVMGWGRDDDVHSAIGKHPPRPMLEIVECASALRTCGFRLRGLYIVAPYWLGGKPDGWDNADALRSWTRVAMGHLADVPGSILGTPGDAPEPPGGWDAIIAAAAATREADEEADRLRVAIDVLSELDAEEDD